jgi:hypothetical protein
MFMFECVSDFDVNNKICKEEKEIFERSSVVRKEGNLRYLVINEYLLENR